MKLKTKVIFGIVASFFAVATVINMSLLNENGTRDVSMDAIAVMAQAQWEGGLNEFDCECETCTNEYDQQGIRLITFYSPGGNCSGNSHCEYGFC